MDALFPVIVIFIFIASAVGLLIWIYIKENKTGNETARKIEIFGYCTLFCLIIWEYVIKNVLMGEFYNSDYYVSEKINVLFYSLNNYIRGSMDNLTYVEWFRDLMGKESEEYLQLQLKCIDIIEMILQIVSTVCIAVGRLQELISNKKDNN